MDWVVLLASGVLEAVWASALAASAGLRKLVPTLVFVVAGVASLAGLGFAMRTLPPGTSYAVWTAVGATLTVLYAMATGKERATVTKLILLTGIIACVVGLKAVA